MEKKKELLKKYGLGVAWILIHDDDKNQVKKIARITEKVGEMEQKLLDIGTPREEIDKVLQKAKEFVKKTVGEMTNRQLGTMLKLIFGQKTEVASFDKREMEKAGNIHFNPVEYAKRIREKKGT